MADTKGSALTPFTPVSTDYLVAVDGIGGTPVTGVVTIAALDTYMEANLSLDAARITAGTLTNARVAETNVTQHQSALTILESQISDLGSYITASSADALTNKTFDANGTGNSISNIDLADLSATGTPSAANFLRGDNTWSVPAGSGDVSKVGTPVNDQIGIWTGDGTIEGVAALTYDGTTLNLTQGIKFTERADHASTPAATFGEIWVKNDAPNNLMFTDDAGTDHQVAMLTPGSSSNLSDKFSTDTKATPLADDYIMSVDPDNGTLAQREVGVTWANANTYLASTTQTLTNKTFDANGTGNSISNIDLADLSATGTASASTFLRGDNSWAVPAGSGDVSKVGTPVDGQIGVWTGDGTIEGDASLTFDTTDDTLVIAASGKLGFGAVDVLSDSSGTTTLQNIDALDSTTTDTIEAALINTPNRQTGTTYTLALTDACKIAEMNNASANTVTIPTNASVAFTVGTIINIVQYGAGATTVTGDTGVTVNGVSAGGAAISARYAGVSIHKTATDEWIMVGSHGTVA